MTLATLAVKHLWNRMSGSDGWLSQSSFLLKKCFLNPCGPVVLVGLALLDPSLAYAAGKCTESGKGIKNRTMVQIVEIFSELVAYGRNTCCHSPRTLPPTHTTPAYLALWGVGHCQDDWVWWRWKDNKGRRRWWGRRGGPQLQWTDQPERRYWEQRRERRTNTDR